MKVYTILQGSNQGGTNIFFTGVGASEDEALAMVMDDIQIDTLNDERVTIVDLRREVLNRMDARHILAITFDKGNGWELIYHIYETVIGPASMNWDGEV